MLNRLEELQKTGISQFLQSSPWAYPSIETLHILSLGILVGSAALWDLRLLGFCKIVEIQPLEKLALNVARVAFGSAVFTGLLLFTTNPVEMFLNPSFRLKILLLAVNLLNIAVFHLSHQSGKLYGHQAKLHAAISLVLWASIIAAGRWIAYV